MQFNNFPPGAVAESRVVYVTKVESGQSSSNTDVYNFSVTVPAATRAYRTFWVDSWVRTGTPSSVTLDGNAVTIANSLNNASWIYVNGSWVNTSISGTVSLIFTTPGSERCAYVLWAAESNRPINFENETVYRANGYGAYSLSKAYARGDAVTATAANASSTWTYSAGGGLTSAFSFAVESGVNQMGGASLSGAGSPGTATWGTSGTSYSYASVTKFTN